MWKKKKIKPEQLAVNVSEETRRKIEEEAETEELAYQLGLAEQLKCILRRKIMKGGYQNDERILRWDSL